MMQLAKLLTTIGWVVHSPGAWSQKWRKLRNFQKIVRTAQKGPNINLAVWSIYILWGWPLGH